VFYVVFKVLNHEALPPNGLVFWVGLSSWA